MNNASSEFQEIGHSGGRVTFTISTDEHGHVSYQVGYSHCRPGPLVLIGIFALEQGIPVAVMKLGGIGDPSDPPPMPGCFPVYIASDSQGKFGHKCPRCKQYWRSGPLPHVCPYCGLHAESHAFLSEAQRIYVQHYCSTLSDALLTIENGEVSIDLDNIADATGKDGPKPSFYISEESQQNKFTCKECGEFNDILGRFGYCSLCGTRNDLLEFEDITIRSIRERLNEGAIPEEILKVAVGSFDSFVAQYAKALCTLIPMTKHRKDRLIKQSFHEINDIKSIFSGWFDIDICKDIRDSDLNFISKMLYRRHVYEHNGGEVDQKYLDVSHDTSVRLKQHIHETKEDVHQFLGMLVKMSRNLHRSFHEIFPPLSAPIDRYKEKQMRIAQHNKH